MTPTKTLEQKIEKALIDLKKGNFSKFTDLYDAIFDHVYSKIFNTAKIHNLSQHLTLHTMDALVAQLYSDNHLFESSETFLSKLDQLIGTQIKKHQNLTTTSEENPDFKWQLKLKLLNKLQNKKNQDPTTLAFYLHHFRFYFTGACFVAVIGLAAFLLGFISFQKTPLIVSSPKLFAKTGAQAFWPLEEIQKNKVWLPSFPLENSYPLPSFWSIPTLQYRISEKELPKLASQVRVAEIQPLSLPNLQALTKSFQLPGITLSSFRSAPLEELNFVYDNYLFNIKLNKSELSISPRDQATTDTANETKKTLTKKQLIKQSEQQLKKRGFNIQHYGSPILSQNETENLSILFYPELFEKKAIYSITGKQIGMSITLDNTSGKLLWLQNYRFQSKLTSEYPLSLSTQNLLDEISKFWISINTQEDAYTQTLTKWELVYQERWNFLLPMVKFEKAEENIFAPLY